MLVLLLVLLTIVFCVTVDHFVRRRNKIASADQQQKNNLTLTQIASLLPAGIFLQPSFTWSKILETGDLMLGIHPVLMGLIGEPDMVETLPDGEQLAKGDILVKIHRDSKILHVKSPLACTILTKNLDFDEASWEDIGRTWLYRVEPKKISSEIPNWFIAEKSKDWIDEKFQQITNFFINSFSQKEMGLIMTDGGELPVGVLSKFDKKSWQDFERKFIT
jgi:glycine cleavage system H lipoate-binding protein